MRTATGRSLARRQAIWIATLFAANFCLQRFSLPGLAIPVTLPLTMLWVGAGLWAGILELNVTRLRLWLVAAAASALVAIPQVALLDFPLISVTSWGLWVVIWLPVVVQLRDRSVRAVRAALSAVADVGVALGAVAVLFTLSQVAGLPYRDYLGELVPSQYLVPLYVTSYPISYGSPIYKANGWLALEPSFLSFMLGVAAIAAIASSQRQLKLLVIALGLVCTAAGSGIALLAVFVVVSVLRGDLVRLARYLPIAAVTGVALATTAVGASVLSRIGEGRQERSSLSLRAVEPYQHLLPVWLQDPWVVLFGRGAGSSQRVVSDLSINGLLVPTPAKLLFDYGLVAGALLLALVVVAHLRSPVPALGAALVVSLLGLQGASQPLVLCSLLTVTLLAPAAPLGRAPAPQVLREMAGTR
ncbi:hypothetical protein GC722_14705 [Auraticoccus sp. F435]|uniref:O-antigen ligase domain-containing protein n=1 Tax=Auraticoccus cholistanensis TaxID=2656650 RepID=A0A6A9UWP4_9ACTN|nr:hypothetical protein [Auraticoccus cholistanensis]MVA77263.1 hypothetical protein [Auraticoccus cholistanensis]